MTTTKAIFGFSLLLTATLLQNATAQSRSQVLLANRHMQNEIMRLIPNTGDAATRYDLDRYLDALIRVENFRSQPGYEALPASRGVCVLSGTVTYAHDTFLECRTIFIRNGFTAVVDGLLYLHASTIYVEGSARITGRGVPGIDGAAGHNGADWTTETYHDYQDSFADCDRGTEAPAVNDRPGHGTDGTPGGDGAIVILSTQPTGQEITFELMAGNGGLGGAAGQGGMHSYFTENTWKLDYHAPEHRRCRSNARAGITASGGSDGGALVLISSGRRHVELP